MSWRKVSRGLGDLVRFVAIPTAGMLGMLLDRPLSVLSFAGYLAMMSLVPAASALDVFRKAVEAAGRDEDSAG